MLAVKVSYTGTVSPRPLILHVPGEQLHQVVGGIQTALPLNRLGQTNREEQGWAHPRDTNTCVLMRRRVWNKWTHEWSGCVLPLWKAQQSSGLQSLWYWQVLPAFPFVAFWLHWPHMHSCSPQHSTSLLQDWGEETQFPIYLTGYFSANRFTLWWLEQNFLWQVLKKQNLLHSYCNTIFFRRNC